MIRRIGRKLKGGSRLINEIVPAIRRVAGPRLRWKALQDSGVVSIGAHTYGFPNVYTWNDETKLRVGKYCSIAEGVVVVLGGEHRMDWITTFPFSAFVQDWPGAASIQGHPATKGDVVVGNDVWIGYGSLILSGVKIGDGAVIGAGSVVTRDVEDYAVVAGNPAKFVKYRFDEVTRKNLKELAWWNWSHKKVSENLEMLMRAPDKSSFL